MTNSKMPEDHTYHEVDAVVARAADAARAFRELDQEQVDHIVDAMVRSGFRCGWR
jgi:acetaldehyde dehydrogenase/alcohol dehydrogenase